ncbi:MAG: phosphate ABC transporter substrate-binding protein [Alphaproteobacteria bacterium CG11_big_fil_rev_8_21_14_0_20_44_7]|nr:MAG: phosphate ABC transporter substrate-binding protein [Alphaproteobacteria bacterium CG11_big_fil_rev_8_21_14_0_20_44_7]
MLNKFLLSILLVATISLPAYARDQIRVVGSSTVYPFVTTVAEQYGRKTGFNTPIVESTGTGGGFKLFCSGKGLSYPDIANASRRIKPNELLDCYKNNVLDIKEIKFGFDGIVLANSVESPSFDLTVSDIFLALARKIPSRKNPNKLVDNYYKSWDEINPSFPKQKISVYGPPPTSGTRDAFVELVMEAGCWHLDAYKNLYENFNERKKACHMIREDGVYVEAGENDNLIVQKLKANPQSLGIFGFSFLEENANFVQGSAISSVKPTHDSIASGQYIISRPLFVYIKGENIGLVPGIEEFIKELVSDEAIAPYGYLEERGLIPLPDAELKKMQKDAVAGKKLENLVEEEKAEFEQIKQNAVNLAPASGSSETPQPAAEK